METGRVDRRRLPVESGWYYLTGKWPAGQNRSE